MKIGFDAKRAAQNRTGLGNYSRFVLRILSQQHPENEYPPLRACDNASLPKACGAVCGNCGACGA